MTHLEKIAAIQLLISRKTVDPSRHWGRAVALVTACSVVMAASVYGQQPERSVASASNFDYAYSNLPTQPVGPDDLLALSVYDSPN